MPNNLDFYKKPLRTFRMTNRAPVRIKTAEWTVLSETGLGGKKDPALQVLCRGGGRGTIYLVVGVGKNADCEYGGEFAGESDLIPTIRRVGQDIGSPESSQSVIANLPAEDF